MRFLLALALVFVAVVSVASVATLHTPRHSGHEVTKRLCKPHRLRDLRNCEEWETERTVYRTEYQTETTTKHHTEVSTKYQTLTTTVTTTKFRRRSGGAGSDGADI